LSGVSVDGAPSTAIFDSLQAQLDDPNSPLNSGVVTRYANASTLSSTTVENYVCGGQLQLFPCLGGGSSKSAALSTSAIIAIVVSLGGLAILVTSLLIWNKMRKNGAATTATVAAKA